MPVPVPLPFVPPDSTPYPGSQDNQDWVNQIGPPIQNEINTIANNAEQIIDNIFYSTPFDDTPVKDILKGKKGSIKQCPLPDGSPSWDDIQNDTWGEIKDKASKNLPGYKTIKKLLGDRRFNK